MIKSIIALFVALAISAAASAGDRTPHWIKVSEVIAKYDELLGRKVAIRGYLRFGDDSRNLWDEKDVYIDAKEGRVNIDTASSSKCITLYDIGRYRKILLKYNQHNVIIYGTIKRVPLGEDEISLGSCNEIGVSVDRVLGLR